MAYSLVIDIGNSRTKFGIFEKQELVHSVILANEELSINSLLFSDFQPKIAIVSSVNQKAEMALQLNEFSIPCIHLNYKTPLPILLDYQSPETLGKDRIAAVVGAEILFPSKAILVIDAGTCLTYDFLTSNKEYIGGAISPGVQMRLKSMNQFTSQLPLLSWNTSMKPETIGRTTISSMLSGAINGLILEIKGFISDFQTQYPDLKIVLTGGDANFFEKELKNGIFADPNLVLKGLNEILIYNQD